MNESIHNIQCTLLVLYTYMPVTRMPYLHMLIIVNCRVNVDCTAFLLIDWPHSELGLSVHRQCTMKIDTVGWHWFCGSILMPRIYSMKSTRKISFQVQRKNLFAWKYVIICLGLCQISNHGLYSENYLGYIATKYFKIFGSSPTKTICLNLKHVANNSD